MKTKTRRMNFSKPEDARVMEECAKARNTYLEGGSYLPLREFWRVEGYEDTGIKYTSYRIRVGDNTHQRKKLRDLLEAQ